MMTRSTLYAVLSLFALSCVSLPLQARRLRKSASEPIKNESSGFRKKHSSKSNEPKKTSQKKPVVSTKQATPLLQPAEQKSANSKLLLNQRISMTRQFWADIDLIKKTILEGETEPTERDDFALRFDNQKRWFDETIRSASATTDAAFIEVKEKLAQINEITNALRYTNARIDQQSTTTLRPEQESRQIKTQVLYEINAQLAKRQKPEQVLSDQELNNLVANTTQKFDQTKEPRLPVNEQPASAAPVASTTSNEEQTKVLEELKARNLSLEIELERCKSDKTKEVSLPAVMPASMPAPIPPAPIAPMPIPAATISAPTMPLAPSVSTPQPTVPPVVAAPTAPKLAELPTQPAPSAMPTMPATMPVVAPIEPTALPMPATQPTVPPAVTELAAPKPIEPPAMPTVPTAIPMPAIPEPVAPSHAELPTMPEPIAPAPIPMPLPAMPEPTPQPEAVAQNRSQFKDAMNFGQPDQVGKVDVTVPDDPYATFESIADLFDHQG